MLELAPFARNNHFLGYYDPFKAMEEFEKNFFGHQVPAFKTGIRETENAYVLDAVGTVGSYTVTQSYGGFDARLFSTIGMENHSSCMSPSSRFDEHLGVSNSLTIDRDTIESWLVFDD